MKRLEHQHAKKSRGIGKIILLGFLAFFVGIPTLLLCLTWIGNKGIAILFLLGCAFLGFWIYKKIKKRQIPTVLNSVIKTNEKAQAAALNLSINNSVDIINPYAGVFISGGAGAGKSKSIIEPLIADCGRKGFTGVVYDFKFPELASYVNTAYEGKEIKTYYINFTDLTRSNRVNPIAPELMINESFAREFAFTILANLNPTMVSKPDFWSENSVTLLTAVFWYLREVYPEFCTLPHAISMVMGDDLEQLLNRLRSVPKCADMVAPIHMALKTGAQNQLAGVVSSLQISLSKINSTELYYLLTENDFDINLNNPTSKGILVIGNNPTLSSTYAPVIGLILTSISKLLNQQGKEKSVFMLDEFPTVYIPNIEQLPATARSNKVATILACQDIAQMVDKYGKEKADTILSNLGNQFYGRTTNPATAQRVSQMFGKSDKLMRTDSKNYESSLIGDLRKGSGESFAYQERDLVKVQDVANLNTGSFYTLVSEGSVRQGLSVIPINNNFKKTEILPFNSVTQWDLDQAFGKVKADVKYILGN